MPQFAGFLLNKEFSSNFPPRLGALLATQRLRNASPLSSTYTNQCANLQGPNLISQARVNTVFALLCLNSAGPLPLSLPPKRLEKHYSSFRSHLKFLTPVTLRCRSIYSDRRLRCDGRPSTSFVCDGQYVMRDDNDWPVHSSMLSHNDSRGIPLLRLYHLLLPVA